MGLSVIKYKEVRPVLQIHLRNSLRLAKLPFTMKLIQLQFTRYEVHWINNWGNM